MTTLPAIPHSLKPIEHLLKTAREHDERDPVVSYWCRYYGLQNGLKLSTKQPEETTFFLDIMDWLEKFKKEHHDNEAITNEVAAQAYLEDYARKLITYADEQEQEANFNKNVVKAFNTAGVIYDSLLTFGELSEEAKYKRKHAKYKAAYIHTLLKNGEVCLVSGPVASYEGSDDDNTEPGPSTPGNDPTPSQHSPIEFKPHPSPIEIDADKLPSPPTDPETPNPGGFHPYVPTNATTIPKYEPPSANVALTAEQMAKAQKYCKYAGSALNFDDVKAAIDNLKKALHLLTTGKE